MIRPGSGPSSAPPATPRGWRRLATKLGPFNPTLRHLQNATAEAQRSRLPQMAAALSYRTVFGLIPVLVVALVAMKLFFTTEDQITDVLNQAMSYSGLSSIATPAPEMGPFPEDAVPAITPEQSQSAERIDEWIRNLVGRVSRVDFKAIGIIGAVALLYAAISMLVEVERAFNQIYRVPAGRSWLRRFVNYWALLCWGGVGLFLSFSVTSWFSKELIRAAAWAGAEDGSAVLIGAVGYLSTVMISTAIFLLIYMVVPNTRVKVGPALVGALAAAIAWEAGKWGFTQYLRFTSGYARLYGSIALIPLFLIWVYLTWCVVLMGLNIAYYLQHGRYQTVAQPTEVPAPVIVDPAAILALMAGLAGRFESGQPATAAAMANQLSLQETLVSQMLERLAEAGLIHRVKQGEKDGYFFLSRPPERIQASEVLKLGEELLGPAAETPSPVMEAMQAARATLVQGRTVASFLNAASLSGPATPASAPKPPPDSPAPVIPAVEPDRPPIPVAPPEGGVGGNGTARGSQDVADPAAKPASTPGSGPGR